MKKYSSFNNSLVRADWSKAAYATQRDKGVITVIVTYRKINDRGNFEIFDKKNVSEPVKTCEVF